MKYRLILKPIARSRSGTMTAETGPIILYEIEGLPEGQKVSLRNIRPDGQEPSWQIGGHIIAQETKWTGSFKTAEEALAQFQKEIDAADKATPDEVATVAKSFGWKDVPGNAPNVLIFTLGPMMIRVRMADGNWAFYKEVVDGAKPDKWGKDLPSLTAFFTSHDKFS